jgi:uncharacterized membrane protein YoaK (UPF0700 family)
VTPTPQLSLGLLLTAAAGFADVVGFIELGGHFTSFMSGNTTQLGLALAQPDWHSVMLPALLVALFFIGSVLGSLLALTGGKRWGSSATTALVLMCLSLTVVFSFAGWAPEHFMLMLAAGAGAQNAILPSTGSVRLGTTFVTGTLFTAGLDLARAIKHQAPPWRWAQHLLVWFSLLLGGLVGGLAYGQWQILALLVPLVVYLCFFIAFVLRPPAQVMS